MSFDDQYTLPLKSYSYAGEPDTSCYSVASPLSKRARTKVDRRSHSSDSPLSCAMRNNLAEDCPHAKFVNWLVHERQRAGWLQDSQRNECPMPVCRGKVFPDFVSMVEHLQTCSDVAVGQYYCWYHDRVEEYRLGNCRSCRCRWAQSSRSLRNAVKEVKQSVKKAITNPHWMPSRGARRANKPDEPSPTPSPITSAPLELMDEAITPELMGQDIALELPASFSMDNIGMSCFPPRYEPYEMETNSSSYQSCYPPAQAELSGEPGGYPPRYGLCRPPVYPQSTVSSMGSWGSVSSISRVSPQASMDLPRKPLPLSINTSVGESPPMWIADQCCDSPFGTQNAGDSAIFHSPQQKKNSWDSGTTFNGSSGDSLQGVSFYGPKFPPLELEGSFPSTHQSMPQEMAGTSFTDGHQVPMSTAGFFPPLPGAPTNRTAVSTANHDQAAVSYENHGIAATRGSPFLEELDFPPQRQMQTPHRADEQFGMTFPDSQGGHFVANPGDLHRAFSFQETTGPFHPASSIHATTGTVGTPEREGTGKIPPNFLHRLETSELPASPPEESPTSAFLSTALRPTPGIAPPRARPTRTKTRKRPAPSPTPPLSPSPSPRQPSFASPGLKGREQCGDCGYLSFGPDRHKLQRRHTKSIHGAPEFFYCRFAHADGTCCEKKYNRPDNLVQHRRRAKHLVHLVSDGSGGGDGGRGGGESKRRKGGVLRKRMDATAGTKAGLPIS